ncbi:hypothetical protein OGAPHI_004992 [Ogataea philodendri]|uniref:Activator of Hsp90 ATPase AHSA1-like N-terminal domain-containing protein n=1 Tax=Ogataea philodendri TaxID=1378263 RepID=A0A9P8T3A1_9ASCO|nr:uncharacterized protein OGAPHI_004992 [Ogataea philodendri]KAH3663591.1 hypothetical protein OGAPHI_004992 [Ogataea philodendri]
MSLFAKLTTPNNKTIEQPLGLFINNEWVKTDTTIDSIDPATGKTIASVYAAGEKEVNLAVQAAVDAFEDESWSGLTGSQRGDYLYKIYEIIKRDVELIASLESWDNGKPYEEECLAGDIVEAYEVFKYYAGFADKIHGQYIGAEVLGKDKMCFTDPVPLGAVASIIPWNFPFMMMAWKLGPALATGNTVVLKSSEITPLSAIYFGKVILEAGLPKGVVNIVSGYGKDAGATLASHPDINKVAFTGSTATGQRIMEAAAKSNLKNVTLECGGKSPFIVFADSDLKKAVEWGYSGIFYNKGEVCTSTSRFYVEESIYDKFVEEFVKFTEENAKVAGPFEKGCTIGPLVSSLQYEKVKKYVEIGQKEGAKLLTGKFHDGPGYFASPFVFGDCTDDMTISREEIFGPVVAIAKFKTTAEVIKRANNTTYGLAAALFSNNITKAHKVASKLQAGMVFINSNGDSDIHVPFGGVKMSGIGRELGTYALELYTTHKAVHVNLGLDYEPAVHFLDFSLTMAIQNPNNWHWVDKNCIEWATQWCKKRLVGVSVGSEPTVSVTSLKKLEGDVEVCQRKGKIFSIFDLQVQLGFSSDNKEGTKGVLSIPELAYDTEIEDFQFDIAFDKPTGSSDEETVRALIRSKLVGELRTVLSEFSSDLLRENASDIQLDKSQVNSTFTAANQEKSLTKTVVKEKTVFNKSTSSEPKPATKVSSSSVPKYNTTSLDFSTSFNTSAEQLYLTLLVPERVAAWTRSPPLIEPKVGSEFQLFGGNIQGKILELEENKRIKMLWRLRDWKEGHYTELELKFNQGQSETQMAVSFKGVPIGDEELVRDNFENYYITSIKVTFGFGAVL